MTERLSLQTGVLWRLTRCQGQALDLSWPWPDGQDRVCLSALLEDLALPLQPLADEAQVRFHRAWGLEASAVAVEHRCQELRCSLNGQWLPPQQLVWLQQGDVLDVGLYRLELDGRQPDADTPASPLACDPAAAAPLADLDLTRLADAPHRQGPPLLLPASAAPASLVDLLGRQDGQPADDPAIAAMTAAPARREDELLDQWHQRYLQRLQSPEAALRDDEDWAHLSLEEVTHRVDAFDQLKEADGAKSPLAHLLGQNDSIEAVLSQLDAHGPVDLFAQGEPPNVLHLFAPAGWAAAQRHERLPSLTRLEHHGISLDSAVPLGTELRQPPPDEKAP